VSPEHLCQRGGAGRRRRHAHRRSRRGAGVPAGRAMGPTVAETNWHSEWHQGSDWFFGIPIKMYW